MLLLLLRTLSRGGATPSPAPLSDPGLVPACSFCLGRAKPPAPPLEPGSTSCPPVAPRGSPPSRCPPGRRGTFLALQRLLERSRSVPELLRWLWQNPGQVSGPHFALALAHLGRLLPQGQEGASRLEPLLRLPDFQHLSRALARRCAHFDDATLLRCLHASAALGLPGDGRLVLALQAEAQRRLDRLRHKDVRMASGNAMRLRPLSNAAPAPPAEPCQEEQRRLQTLLVLLSYYRLRAQKRQEEAPPVQREILRLVRLALRQLPVAEEPEGALLEEMLSLCAREASGSATLGAIFGSWPFFRERRENFVRSMADWFPGRVEALPPPTVALAAKYLARHRLREPRLLDAIATFLQERAQQLDSKMIQRLVFPFSRLNFRPSNHGELFPRLEEALQKPGVSPLAALNVLMSLAQLCHLPPALLGQVFAPAFLANVTSSPCSQIALRYLSLLDAAVALELPEYRGPRLPPQYRVCMFEGALTADEANHKYSYKGLVGEALGQLVGRDCFRQNEVVPPGYCVDFLLWVTPSGTVLPLGGTHSSPKGAANTLASGTQNSAPLGLEPTGRSLRPPGGFCGPSAPSLSSPWQVDPSPAGSPCSSNTTLVFSPPGGPETEQGLPVARGHFSPQGCSPEGTAQQQQQQGGIHRVVLSVNDQWHHCHGSSVLVGSRAMRSRHLRLLGYRLVQLPFQELEKLRGIEETKIYLRGKLLEELPL